MENNYSQKKLSEKEIRDLFNKYDVNKDNTIDSKELTKMVSDIYLKSHNLTELNEKDKLIINKSVVELLKLKDLNKDGHLQFEEFMNHYNGQDIYHHTENLLSDNRFLVYSNRIALLMRRLNSVMASSRPLAYASEMGESVRPLVPPFFVRFLYGVSWGYVILDTAVKTYSVKDQGREIMSYYAMDTSIWHTFASMALPAFTIHSIVKYSGKLLKNFVNPLSRFGRFGPTIIGMSSIPFIIHPLDHFTDWAMDNSLRKLYSDKLPKVPGHH